MHNSKMQEFLQETDAALAAQWNETLSEHNSSSADWASWQPPLTLEPDTASHDILWQQDQLTGLLSSKTWNNDVAENQTQNKKHRLLIN